MDKEQIIQMARDAGSCFAPEVGSWLFTNAEIERFAAAIRAATKEEDAKICEDQWDIDGSCTAKQFAQSIRASK